MSQQSDAAKAHIEKLLTMRYLPFALRTVYGRNDNPDMHYWHREYRFAPPRRFAFDYAVPAVLCAISGLFLSSQSHPTSPRGEIEIDGGTFQNTRTGHSSGVGLRAWREKHNAAMTAGWRVWHYAPEEIIKAGRKRPFADSQVLTPSTIPQWLRNPAR